MSDTPTTRWHTWWRGLAPREQRALAGAAAVLGAALLWSVAIAPAWRTLQHSPDQRTRQAPQLQAMRAMAAEASALRSRGNGPQRQRADVLRELEATTRRLLGASAQLQPGPAQVTVTLKAADATALARWLNDTRLNTGLQPAQAHWEHPANDTTHWNGSVILTGNALEQP